MFRNRASCFGTALIAFAESEIVLRRGDARRQDFTRRRVTLLGNLLVTVHPKRVAPEGCGGSRPSRYRGFAGGALKA